MSNDRVTYYESLYEVQQLITNGGDQSDLQEYQRSSLGRKKAWSGNVTVNQAANMLLYGWQDKEMDFQQEVDALLDQLSDRMNVFIQDQHRTVLDSSGGFVDIQRVIAGEPENMYETYMDPEASKGKALKVAVNLAASSGVNPEWIKRRGVAVAAAAKAVSTMGFNVELWVGQSVTNSDRQSTEMIKVKDYFDPLDDEVALFSMAHPGMLRKIVFWLEEQHESEWRQLLGFGEGIGGYGSPSNFPSEVRNQFDLVIERGQSFEASEIVNQLVFTNEEDRLNEYQ